MAKIDDIINSLLEPFAKRLKSMEDSLETNIEDIEIPENRDIQNKEPFIVEHTINSTDAATAANFGSFWIAPFECEVVKIQEVHEVKGSDRSDVTLQVERLQSGEASAAGDDLLATAFDLKGTADTVQTGTLVKTDVRILKKDDRLGLVDAGTLTALDTVTVVITLRSVGQGHYRSIK